MPLSERSKRRLTGVHPHLVRVVEAAAAATDLPFQVTEGLRTKERQVDLVKAGASQTMNSRHLTGHAVDVAPVVAGTLRWDWPLFDSLAVTFKAAAASVAIPVEWGGDWKFRDGPHFQLPWKEYPQC